MPGIQKKEGEERGISHKMYLGTFENSGTPAHPTRLKGKGKPWGEDPLSGIPRGHTWTPWSGCRSRSCSGAPSGQPTRRGTPRSPPPPALPPCHPPPPPNPPDLWGRRPGFRERKTGFQFDTRKNIRPYGPKKKIRKLPVCRVTETSPPQTGFGFNWNLKDFFELFDIDIETLHK